MEPAFSSQASVVQPRTQSETEDDRLQLLQRLVSAAVDTAHGTTHLNEQQISELLSGLVRFKLLSADDSYKLKDRLSDQNKNNSLVIEERIESALRRRGIITKKMCEELETRIKHLETKNST